MRHSAGQDLVNNKHKITALTYGTSGLLNFVDTLFTQLAARKQVHKHFNYYFALKKQLAELEELSENGVKNSMLTAGSNMISKESDDLQIPLPNEALKISATGDRLALQPSFAISPRRRVSEDEIRAILSVNQSINVKSGVVKNCVMHNFKNEDAVRKNKHMWVLPNGWRERPKAMRQSFQYIMLKVKLLSMFEDNEDAAKMVLDEFFAFPQTQRDIFPKTRFLELLRHLTKPQKKRYITLKLAKGESAF